MGSFSSAESIRKQLSQRFSEGTKRVKESFFQSLQIVLAAMGAYLFAQKVLGHHEPIFAATAAIVSLGFVRGTTHARRILEVSLGVTLGILIGDLLMLFLGQGIGQATLVLLFSILVARFLDKGIIFTIQMGVQSCLVVLMTPNVNGVFARSLDGIVGGFFAFLLMFIFPKDSRQASRGNVRKLMEAYALSLKDSALALQHYKSMEAHEALESARKLQALYNAAEADLITAKGMAQLSALGKSHSPELTELSKTLAAVDLAIRNTRVFDRRMESTLRNVQLSGTAIHSLSQTLYNISDGVTVLGHAMSKSDTQRRHELKAEAQKLFIRLAQVLDPAKLGVRTLEGESLVLMLRPLLVDLLQATGMTVDQALTSLIPLGQGMTEHAPQTQILDLVEKSPTAAENYVQTDTRALNIILRQSPANTPETD